MDYLLKKFDLFFAQQAPTLPLGTKKIVAAVIPWIAILSALLALPNLNYLLGFNGFQPLPTGLNLVALQQVATIISLISGLFWFLAIPGLFRRTSAGWTLALYASLLSILSSFLAFDVIGGILGFFFDLYFLFQVRHLFHHLDTD